MWFKRKAPPSPVDVLRAQLIETRFKRAEQAALREYHQAMEDMLVRRIERLVKEIGDE